MALPPLDIEAAAGAAAGDVDPPGQSTKADADRAAAMIHSLRVGTNVRQAFFSQKNRRFDVGGGLIVHESIVGSQERRGFYVQTTYFPRIGIERYMDFYDPANWVFVPTIQDAYPRIRLGVHGTVDFLSFDSASDVGATVSVSAEFVRRHGFARVPGCIARFGYSGEDSIGLKLTAGVRQVGDTRYGLATLGITVRLPAVGGVITPPVWCGDDDDDE